MRKAVRGMNRGKEEGLRKIASELDGRRRGRLDGDGDDGERLLGLNRSILLISKWAGNKTQSYVRRNETQTKNIAFLN